VDVPPKMPPVRFRCTTPDVSLSHLQNLFVDCKTHLRSVFRFRLISRRAIIWSHGALRRCLLFDLGTVLPDDHGRRRNARHCPYLTS
jgi:hypothetical protein